jgi:hypothetical protein
VTLPDDVVYTKDFTPAQLRSLAVAFIGAAEAADYELCVVAVLGELLGEAAPDDGASATAEFLDAVNAKRGVVHFGGQP